ncbi:MAG TPA: SGNH/GDSL hydrolase family protein [Gaiellaceae bacterium]|nr:SGNH/GDSL hydrolase family protein [Gaiellaceae bacterium]
MRRSYSAGEARPGLPAVRIGACRSRAAGAGLAVLAALVLSGCGGAARSQPPTGATATTTAIETPPVSLWIGDSYTVGAGATSSATGEALATSAALGWQTDLDAEGGTGFVAAGHAVSPGNEPVPDRLPSDARRFRNPSPGVVVLDAGRNDRGIPMRVVRPAVLLSLRELRRAFPSAAVVVIAPFLMRSKPTDYAALRRLLEREARRYGWAFVDPIAEGWIGRASAKLVAPDGVHPDQAGYDYLVAHLAPAIEHALAAAHETVR